MSWHCSLALVEAFSDRGSLDRESCARLKSIRTVEKSCFVGKRRDTSRLSLSGTMSEPSMVARGVDSWMSSLRASHASPSASRESNRAPTTSATYGPRRSVSSKRSVPDTSCSKMCPGFADTCPWSSETCEELATPSKGPSPLPPQPWVQDILGGGSGYVPTTKASASGPDYARAKRPRSGGDDLVTALHRTYLPTTSAKEYGYNQGGGAGRVGPKRPSLRGHLGGSPNPDWLDWFVGLPIGWSGLPPLETSKFQRWCEQHGSC